MDDLAKIINQRAIPGTMIFDLDQRLLFINREALELLPKKQLSRKAKGATQQDIPLEILGLCQRIQEGQTRPADSRPPVQNGVVLEGETGFRYSARAFLIGRRGEEKETSHIMVLLERVTEKHSLNYEGLTERFALSKREVEVVRLICEGRTNREIGEKLYISEYTVKDHIKNIMRKMDVATRNEIVAVLL